MATRRIGPGEEDRALRLQPPDEDRHHRHQAQSEGDELVDVVVTEAKGDEVVLATAEGMAIRFSESDARPMGRNASGVKGINLLAGDELVGMVVADPDATLLTATEQGYGKRTPFGPNAADGDDSMTTTTSSNGSSARYRTQNRGGKGLARHQDHRPQRPA